MLNTKEIIEQMKAYEIKSVEERYKNLSEKEIKEIAEALNCDYEINLIDRVTGEKI